MCGVTISKTSSTAKARWVRPVPLANRHVHHLVVRGRVLVEHGAPTATGGCLPTTLPSTDGGPAMDHGCKRCTGRVVPRIALRVPHLLLLAVVLQLQLHPARDATLGKARMAGGMIAP